MSQLASVLVALLTGVGVAFGGWGVLQVIGPARSSAPESRSWNVRPGPPRPNGDRTSRPSRHAAQPALTAPAPKPTPSAEARRMVRPEAHPQDVLPRDPRGTVASTPNQLSLESEALARALVKLRRERDPHAALAALDEYELEFPNGALFLEAQVARVDALLALGKKASVLTILSELPLDRVGRGMELRLIRAELTAEHDCRRARADLDALVEAAPPSVRERALPARAACLLRLGEERGAIADLRAYLAAYPSGRFAAEARAHLQRLSER